MTTTAADPVARRSGTALLVAMAVDNLGSGLFLPLSVVYLNRVVGLPIATAGLALTVGSALGLLVPAVAGRVVERLGPRPVVVASQLLQAVGLAALLAARAVPLALLGAVLVAMGTQTFYSAVFGLVADVAPPGPKDRPFAVFGMVRSAAFGVGTLVAGVLLTVADRTGLTVAVAADAVTFVLAALMLLLLVHLPVHHATVSAVEPGPPVLRNRPYLVLIAVAGLIAVATDVFLIGLPVFTLDVVGTPAWVPGVCLAAVTVAGSAAATLVLRWTRGWTRTASLSRGAVLTALWAGGCAVTPLLPRTAATAWLLAVTLLLVGGNLLVTARVNALAEAAAPPASRGRHLAAFQYAFSVAALLAPLLVATFTVASWLPWVVVGGAALVAVALMPWLTRHLPAVAVGADRSGLSAPRRP